MKKLIREVHRRSLWQVLGIYLAVSWVVLQVIDVLANNIGLPEWVAPTALALLLVGLPIVVGTAFVQGGISSKGPEPGEQSLADGGELPAPAPTRPRGHRRLLTWRNALIGGGGAFALLGLLTAGYLFMRASGIGPAGTLVAKGLIDESASVLLGDFQSPSGDTDLASAATEALRIDLSQSGVIALVPRAQIADILTRMDRAADTRLDPDVAREAAQRGGISAVIDGQIDAAGRGFVLSARLVSASDGAVLVSRRETASDSSEVIRAIDALSDGLRERIGESLGSIARTPPLEQVTTPSLRALRLYSQSENAVLNEGDVERGLALLEEALEADSTFAMAWRKVATIRGNQGLGLSGVFEAIDRAYRYRDRLPDRDRYLTVASYFQERGDRERAAIAYETLLETQPEEAFALTNLGILRDMSGQDEAALSLFERAWAADSIGLSLYHVARMLQALGRQDEADARLAELRTRFPDYPLGLVLRLTIAATRGDFDAADSALAALRRAHSDSPLWRGQSELYEGALRATRGRLRAASEAFARARDLELSRNFPARFIEGACDLAFLRLLVAGDTIGALAPVEDALARVPLESLDPRDRPYARLAAVYALAGRTARAKNLMARFDAEVSVEQRGYWSRDDHHFARGEIALAEGRAEEAVRHFEEARNTCSVCPLARLAEARARAAPDHPTETFEVYIASPASARVATRADVWYPSGDWLSLGPSLERLAGLYDDEGDLQSAAKYYARFVGLWADADEELQPRVQAAQARLEAILREIG